MPARRVVCLGLALLAWKSGPAAGESEASSGAEDAEAAFPNFDCWGDDWDTPHEVWSDLYDLINSIEKVYDQQLSPVEMRAAVRAAARERMPALLGYVASGQQEKLSSDCRYGQVALRLAQWSVCRLVAMPASAEEAAAASRTGLLGTSTGPGSAQTWPGASGEALEWPSPCADLRVGLSELFLPPATLPTMLNSRWMRPYCGIAQITRAHLRTPADSDAIDPLALARKITGELYDCTGLPEGASPSGVHWHRFRQALDGESSNALPQDWLTKTIPFVFTPGILQDSEQKVSECAMGFAMVMLEKLHIAQTARTEEYGKLSLGFTSLAWSIEKQLNEAMLASGELIEQMTDSMSVWMMTSWPVVPLLCSLARSAQADTPSGRHGYQYKPYALDFHPEEILRPRAERAQLTEVRQFGHYAHIKKLRDAEASANFRQSGLTKGKTVPFMQILQALKNVLLTWVPGKEGIAGQKLIIVTMVWGMRLAQYLPGVLRRAEGFQLHTRYAIFCLDDAALEVCLSTHPDQSLCVPGELQTIYNKYTILSTIIQLGFDVLYLDFDTLLLADPVPWLVDAAKHAEILVSRDFGSQCLNTGVIYMKAHPDTAELLTSLLVWLWHHPYEFSQKAFSAFLRHENATDARFSPLPLEDVPRWDVLEPTNAFVTSAVYHLGVEGWTGRLDGIVIFHFLDGTGGVDPERAIEGRYMNLYELFYDNPKLDLADVSRPLWEQDERIERVLLRSRLPEAPKHLEPCMLLDSPAK